MNYVELQHLTRQVADALGFEWAYREQTEFRHWQSIDGPEGAAIDLRIDKGRLRIGGQNPEAIHNHDGGGDWWPPDRVVIGCAATKTPGQIASDIRRRLLPEYLPAYRESLADRERYREYLKTRNALLEELVAIVPGTVSRHGKGDLSYNGPTQVHGNFEVRMGVNRSTPTVALDLSGVPIGLAKEILGMLARRIEEDAKQ